MTKDATGGTRRADVRERPDVDTLSHAEFRAAIHSHLPALRNFALGLTRDPAQADDIVQDTLLRAWANVHLYTPGSNLQSWLFTILHRTFVSDLRKAERRARLETVEIDPITLPAHDGKLVMRDFMRVFDVLSSKHRDVIVLVGILGFSYEEAAALLGISAGTAKSRVSHARQHLLVGFDPPRRRGADRADHAE